MKKVILCLLLGTGLAGCTATPSNLNIKEYTVEDIGNTMTSEELFEKKQICAKYKKEIEDDVLSKDGEVTKVVEIFYSPKKNSCLYITEFTSIMDNNTIYQDRECIDYLNSKTLVQTPTKCIKKNKEIWYNDIDCPTEYTDTENQIKKLKGEY